MSTEEQTNNKNEELVELTLDVDDETYAWIQQRAQEDNITEEELIINALKEFLETQKAKYEL